MLRIIALTFVFLLSGCAMKQPLVTEISINQQYIELSDKIRKRSDDCWTGKASMLTDPVLVEQYQTDEGDHVVTASWYAMDTGLQDPHFTLLLHEDGENTKVKMVELVYPTGRHSKKTEEVMRWLKGNWECDRDM